MTKSKERWWALAGPAFAVLFWAVIFALEGSTPGEKASAVEVVNYFNSHKGRTVADVFLAPLLVALLLLSVAYLRNRLRQHERGMTSRLGATMLVVGTAIWASGALLGSVAQLTLVTSSDNGQVEIAHTVNVLSNSLWVPFIAGIAATLIGAGLSVVSTSVLPHWMGWVALGVGIVSLAGPGGFLGFFVAPLWLLVAGVMLFLRPEAEEVSVPRARTDASAAASDRTTTAPAG
jgi:hypothetical protein